MKFEDTFLPTKQNDYTPHLLQKVAIFSMFLLVFLSFAAVNLQSLLWQSSSWLVGTVLPAVIVDLTNEKRGDLSETPLVRSNVLDEAAQLKAEHMAKNGYFAHYSPDGTSPWYWFDEVSYTYAYAGENLAIHFNDSSSVVEAWMKSPLHRDNIVNQNYTEIGVGTAKGMFEGRETVFVVQLFGTPASPIQPKPVVAKAPVPKTEPSEKIAPKPEPATLEEVVNSAPESKPDSEPQVVESPALSEREPGSAVLSSVDSNVSVGNESEVTTATLLTETKPLLLSHLATTSGLLPLSLAEGMGGTTVSKASAIGSLATSPNQVLQVLYLIIGSLVAVLLIMSVIVEIRHQRPLHVAYGIALLMIMSGLFFLQAKLTTSVSLASETVTYEQQNV